MACKLQDKDSEISTVLEKLWKESTDSQKEDSSDKWGIHEEYQNSKGHMEDSIVDMKRKIDEVNKIEQDLTRQI